LLLDTADQKLNRLTSPSGFFATDEMEECNAANFVEAIREKKNDNMKVEGQMESRIATR